MDVKVVDEIVWVCGGEDDDFDVAGVGSLGESSHEGGEIGCELESHKLTGGLLIVARMILPFETVVIVP